MRSTSSSTTGFVISRSSFSGSEEKGRQVAAGSMRATELRAGTLGEHDAAAEADA